MEVAVTCTHEIWQNCACSVMPLGAIWQCEEFGTVSAQLQRRMPVKRKMSAHHNDSYFVLRLCRVVTGAESVDVCVNFVSPSSTELTDRPRRQTGASTTAAQHTVGNDLPCRDAGGLLTFTIEMLSC